MTVTNEQVRKLMKNLKKHKLSIAATKAGMDIKTARKYAKNPEFKKDDDSTRHWRTRSDPFEHVWEKIEELLSSAPGLQANTILDWLLVEYPNDFKLSQLRTLQRRCTEWRACNGPDKDIIFPQIIYPGRQSQSDCTWMNKLKITINGEQFDHMLFHFMLPYSRWETVSICYSESFESLTKGYETSVWELGAVPVEHRTDCLTAATHKMGNSREFNRLWCNFLNHYCVKPSRNNPGESHENGSIEKSNHLIKVTIDQQLMLRGSRDFSDIDMYIKFLQWICKIRNHGREDKLLEEMQFFKPLPDKMWNAPEVTRCRVLSDSTVRYRIGVCSVPSRLIGLILKVHIYPDMLKMFYGNKEVFQALRTTDDVHINYRHVIARLLRKPGAFADYQYKDFMFPRLVFRKAYDFLLGSYGAKGDKKYLEVLNHAAITSEVEVATALNLLLEDNIAPSLDQVKGLVDLASMEMPTVHIDSPDLSQYDHLLTEMEVKNVTPH